ncbi:MAG: hypothetical protein WA584_23245 [Pyrinomonadaceae bacterium]
MKFQNSLLLIILVFSLNCGRINKTDSAKTTQPTAAQTATPTAQPIFNAAALIGKSPKEVDKILGAPVEAWTARDNVTLFREYSLGEDTTVEFRQNHISSLVIFFTQEKVFTETAYQLVGLNINAQRPKGISNITSGPNWIKIFYQSENSQVKQKITNMR